MTKRCGAVEYFVVYRKAGRGRVEKIDNLGYKRPTLTRLKAYIKYGAARVQLFSEDDCGERLLATCTRSSCKHQARRR